LPPRLAAQYAFIRFDTSAFCAADIGFRLRLRPAALVFFAPARKSGNTQEIAASSAFSSATAQVDDLVRVTLPVWR